MKLLTRVAAAALTATTLVAAHLAQAADTMLALAPHRTNEPSLVPSDHELEQRGARIGHIEIQVDEVFENSLSLAAPYKVANGLHISTHSQTVRQQLLFRSGEPFHRRVPNETERLLLGKRYPGLGNVLHIDLAIPLDRANGIDAVQLLLETRKSF
jgi:hypothetical protein